MDDMQAEPATATQAGQEVARLCLLLGIASLLLALDVSGPLFAVLTYLRG
jgi:hypothetical protein